MRFVPRIILFSAVYFVGILAPTITNAQTAYNYTHQLWLDFNPTWNLGERKTIVADVDYRANWPHSWNRFVARAGYQYRAYNFLFKKVKTDEDFLAGIGFFDRLNNDGVNSYEFRPYQGYKVSFFLSNRWKMRNYLRLEERFIVNPASNSKDFSFRARYQISADYYIRGKIFENAKGFYVPLSIEFFFNIVDGNTINEVLRVTPGLGYQFNSDFRMHSTFGCHFTQYNIQGLNAVVYRVSVYKTIF